MADIGSGWEVISATRIGTSHRRSGLPNQDALASKIDSECRWAVVAVADGHGSRRCLRSDRGSKFAAETAIELLQSYTESGWETTDVRRDAEAELPQRLVLRWRELVDADISTQPFTAIELDALSLADRSALTTDHRTAYGTTVVAAMISNRFAVFLQLGDGDVLVLSERDDVPSRPLPQDPRSFANETASLATSRTKLPPRPGERGPWADLRVRVVPLTGAVPTAVLLTTDGYPNAFANDSEFLKAAASLGRIGRDHGWDYVREELAGWLDEASVRGSGDDVTVALMIRIPTPCRALGDEKTAEVMQQQPGSE